MGQETGDKRQGTRDRGQGLTVPQACYEEILAHCQQEYPKEACGILAGKNGIVERVYPMENVEASPIGYSMDSAGQLHVEKQMRQARQGMIGIYHSHTASEAYPSSVDVSLAISPDISYVLVSLKDRAHPVMHSYRIDGQIVTKEVLLVGESQV